MSVSEPISAEAVLMFVPPMSINKTLEFIKATWGSITIARYI